MQEFHAGVQSPRVTLRGVSIAEEERNKSLPCISLMDRDISKVAESSRHTFNMLRLQTGCGHQGAQLGTHSSRPFSALGNVSSTM